MPPIAPDSSRSVIERGDEVLTDSRRGTVAVIARMSRDTDGFIVCWVEWDDGPGVWLRLRKVNGTVIVHSVPR